LRPHTLPVLTEPLPPSGGRVLAVLGNIRHHKGARVLEAMARMRPDLKIILIGSLDPSIKAPSNLRVLGPYRREEITIIAREHQIGAWLIPSIWPETFCFSLHEALATGLPTFGFDLGAQGDTLRAAAAMGQSGFAVPPGASPEVAAAEMLAALAASGLMIAGV